MKKPKFSFASVSFGKKGQRLFLKDDINITTSIKPLQRTASPPFTSGVEAVEKE